MPVEFTGRDLVTTFHEHPDNQAIRQYKVTYQCATDLVVHFIKVEDAQGKNGDDQFVYKDRLSYAENMAAGLTREPVVTLYAQNADLEWSDGYEIESINPQPTLPSTPTVQSTINGAFLRIIPPSDSDIAGYRVWKSATSPVALVDGNLIHDGPDTSVAISIPAAGSYYVVVAPYDSFDKTGLNPSDEITVEKADPTEGLGLEELQEQITTAQEEIEALTTVYGDTAAAAASAAAAQAAETNAEAAEANAEAAQALAQTAKADAESARATAIAQATNAGNSATLAAGHASTASTKADEAAGSASAAASSATTASTSAGNASTSAGNAASSATTASGHASSASTSASTAASSAAAGTQTVASTLPSNFNQDGQFWAVGYSGAPTRASLATAPQTYASFPTVSGIGKVLEVAGSASAGRDISALGADRYVSGRKYRVTAMVRTLSGTQNATLWFIGMDESYAYNNAGVNITVTADTSWQLVTVNVTTNQPAGTVYMRPLMRLGLGTNTAQWSFCKLEDITESEAAAGSASAAATSATTAGTSATNAGTSASAANTSATNAATSAGQASTHATNASNSATTASGHASTASTSATTAANSASAAALTAALMLPSRYASSADTSFSNTPIGDPATMGTLLSNDTDPSFGPIYRTTLTNQSFDWAPKGVVPATDGRIYEFTVEYEVISFSGSVFLQLSSRELNASFASINARVVSRTIAGTGVFTDTMLISNAASTGVMAWDPAAVWIRPYVRVQSNAGTCSVRYRSLTIRDVTEREAAADSASAAATSATTAGTKATEAGNSATAANTSATNAATSAGQASTYASNASTSSSSASTSASNASGSASSAATSATTAANSSNAARMAAAFNLPSDFSNGGETWFAGYHGDPADRVPIAASGWASFPTVAGVGKVLQAVGANDIAAIGVVRLQAGRTYKATARYRVTGSLAGNISLYMIGLDSSYAYSSSASTLSNHAPSQNVWADVSVTIAANASISGGGVYLRPMFRTYAGNTFQVQFIRFEDVTESLTAAGSASAASTSASTATTQATNAGNSATAASNSATAASTSASNASSSASAANSSATGASDSAAAASNSAAIAASVNTGALNRSPTFSDNANATGLPTNWGSDGTYPGGSCTRVTGPNGVGYSATLVGGAANQSYMAGSMPAGTIRPNSYYVVEYDVTLNSGTFVGAGGYLSNSVSGSVHYIPFVSTLDESGVAPGNGVVGRTYRFRKLFKTESSVSTSGVSYFYAMSHWSTHGSIAAANSITWHRALIRPATSSEVAMGGPDGLEASVEQLQGALATIGGRTSAYWQTQTNAGAGASTFITAQSESNRPEYGPITLNRGTYGLPLGEVVREGLDIKRVGLSASTGWTYGAATEETYSGAAYIAFQSGPISSNLFMIGLTDVDTASGYSDIDYAWYINSNSNLYYVYESGSQNYTSSVAPTTSDFYEIIYTAASGGTITYRRNGEVIRTVTGVGAGRTFRLQASLYYTTSRVRNVVFGSAAPSMSSAVSIGAAQFHIYNPAGSNWKKALEISGGNAIFSGGITAGTYIKMGNGNGWPVGLAARDFTVSDGTSITFDTTLASLPAVDFSTNGLAALSAGETYNLYAESLSTTGFTARLKIITPGTPVYNSLTTDTAPGSGPTRQIDKSAYGDAITGSYNVSCNGSITVTNEYEPGTGWISNIGITVSVWVKRGGVWTSVAVLETGVAGSGGPTSSLTWYASGPVNLGYQPASAIQAVGVTVSAAEINQGGISSGPTVNDFTALTWTSSSASSTRSATPSSQTTTSTVRPQ